ncbi:MAG TPA: ABC transporter substrate binding protein, partial [Nitrospirota bacterium]|nr:ABC transporter substrate binding protein [Nitrospirota bacterium]
MYHVRLNIQKRIRPILFALGVLSVLIAFLPIPAHAFNVIVVKSGELKPYQDALRGFRDACNCDAQELKLDEGDGAGTVLRESPDAVVAIGTTVFKKVRGIEGLPVIYAMVMPSEAALSLRPNISGVSMDISPETYIATMKQLFPAAKKIGLLYDPQHTAAFVAEAAKAAHAAGLELVDKQVRDPREIPGLLDMIRGTIDVLWMVPDATIAAPEAVDYLLYFSFQNSVPIFSFSKKYVERGAVAALDVDPYDMGTQAGEIVN